MKAYLQTLDFETLVKLLVQIFDRTYGRHALAFIVAASFLEFVQLLDDHIWYIQHAAICLAQLHTTQILHKINVLH